MARARSTHVAEVAGMEGQVVTMQDLFRFEQTGIDTDGRVLGELRTTGIRPRFAEKFEVVRHPPADRPLRIGGVLRCRSTGGGRRTLRHDARSSSPCSRSRGNTVPAARHVRGRLDGLMSGTSVVETSRLALCAIRPRQRASSRASPGRAGRAARRAARARRHDDPSRRVHRPALRARSARRHAVPIVPRPGHLRASSSARSLAVVGYNLPKFYSTTAVKTRVDKLNAQLPEALTIISNSLKAGFGLLQALSTARRSSVAPDLDRARRARSTR